MSIYILFFLLLKSFYSRSYDHWNKSAVIEFSLKSNEEKGLYLDYSDVFEKDDVAKDNNLYFLKINRELKVNCIIKNGNSPPEEASFNRNKLNQECQLTIELNNNNKLVSFPKSLTKNDRVYFIFFLGYNNLGNEKEDYLTETIYKIKRIAYPELLKIQDNPYELTLSKENTFIYLMKPEPENFNILSTLSNFNISIYGYKKDKNFEQLGYIGENNFIFQLNDSLELDSNYTFIVINNENEEIKKVQFSYNEQIRLRTLNISQTSSVNYIDFRTALSLLQIYNPEQKLLKFTYYEDHWLRVLDENHSNMKKILDLTFYKYIPQGYFYQPTKYTIFLINTGHRNNKFQIEAVTLSNAPNSIEMDKFVYFQILKGRSLSFNVKFPENKIIVKLMCTDKGKLLINSQNYQLTQQNQILEIDNENKSKFTITAVDNNFILAVKSKIPEKYIHYANLPFFNVPTNNEKAFIAIKVDYNNRNYDYAFFSIEDNKDKTNDAFSSDFGFLTENEFSINSMRVYKHIYDLKYYKTQKKQDLLKVYYVPDITSSSDITLSGFYYSEVKYLPNKFQRIWDDLVLFVGNKRTRLFFITETKGYFTVYCKGTIVRGEWINSEYFDNFSSKDFNCYEEIYISGYIYMQSYENDKEFYSFDESLKSKISLEVKDKKTIQVAFPITLQIHLN